MGDLLFRKPGLLLVDVFDEPEEGEEGLTPFMERL
jgi:hypothetical protein